MAPREPKRLCGEGAKISDVKGWDVYSTVLVGPGASGAVRLFMSTLGQPIPRLGTTPDTIFTSNTPFTTSMWRPCQLDFDFAAEAVRVDFVGADLAAIDAAFAVGVFELRVSGKREIEGPLRDLPHIFKIPVRVDRNDTFEGILTFRKKLPVQMNPFLLRVVVSGRATFDIR